MPMQHTIQGKKAIIKIDGPFDFNAGQEFRKNYEQILSQEGLEAIDIDLATVNVLDSGALGMLLLLREKAKVNISLLNSKGGVRQLLEVANFHKMFVMK